jgi:hypothetical protein
LKKRGQMRKARKESHEPGVGARWDETAPNAPRNREIRIQIGPDLLQFWIDREKKDASSKLAFWRLALPTAGSVCSQPNESEMAAGVVAGHGCINSNWTNASLLAGCVYG